MNKSKKKEFLIITDHSEQWHDDQMNTIENEINSLKKISKWYTTTADYYDIMKTKKEWLLNWFLSYENAINCALYDEWNQSDYTSTVDKIK